MEAPTNFREFHSRAQRSEVFEDTLLTYWRLFMMDSLNQVRHPYQVMLSPNAISWRTRAKTLGRNVSDVGKYDNFAHEETIQIDPHLIEPSNQLVLGCTNLLEGIVHQCFGVLIPDSIFYRYQASLDLDQHDSEVRGHEHNVNLSILPINENLYFRHDIPLVVKVDKQLLYNASLRLWVKGIELQLSR
jgi:hypothetical protein